MTTTFEQWQAGGTDVLKVLDRIITEEDTAEFRVGELSMAGYIRGRLEAAGYVIVPKVPTPAMVAQGESAASFGIGKPTSDDAIPKVWTWMIDAFQGKPHGGS